MHAKLRDISVLGIIQRLDMHKVCSPKCDTAYLRAALFVATLLIGVPCIWCGCKQRCALFSFQDAAEGQGVFRYNLDTRHIKQLYRCHSSISLLVDRKLTGTNKTRKRGKNREDFELTGHPAAAAPIMRTTEHA